MNATNPAENATPNAAPDTPQPKPRMWMFVAWFGVVAIAALLMLASIVMVIGGGLNAQISELEKAGEPTSLQDLKQRYAVDPPEQNAAIILGDLGDEIDALQKEIAILIDSRKTYEDPWTPEQAKSLDAFINKNSELLGKVRAAIRLPEYGPIIEYVNVDEYFERLIEDSAGNRTTARLLRLQAEALALRGDWEGAAECGLDIIRYGHHLENNPTMNNYLVSLAVRQFGVMTLNEALQDGSISDELRKRIHTEIGLIEPEAGFIEALRTERAVAIDRTRNGGGGFAMARMLRPLLAELEQWIDHTKKNGLNLKTAPKSAGPTLIPTQAVHMATVRWVAQSRALRLLEAVTASDLPEVDDLSALSVPPEVRLDPFAEPKQMTVKRANGGWTIYSVGPDGIDNAGGGDDIALTKKPKTPARSESKNEGTKN